MAVPKLGYTIVYVPNVSEAIGFYGHAFGIDARFVHESGTYGELETGATALAFADETLPTLPPGFAKNRADGTAPGIELGLVCEDVAAAFARAVAAGAVAVLPPSVKPWGQTVAYVRDPNGVLVELCSAMG